MRLPQNLLYELLNCKDNAETAKIDALIAEAFPEPKGDGILKPFSTRIKALVKEHMKVKKIIATFDSKLGKLKDEIEKNLGSGFYWDLSSGISQRCTTDSLAQLVRDTLRRLIHSELITLQIQCLTLKPEKAKDVIAAFQAKDLATMALADVKQRLTDEGK
jgi:hypothetical protein